MTWKLFGAICTLITAAGALFDLFVLPRIRGHWAEPVIGFWLFLDGHPIRDFPKLVASKVIQLFNRYAPKRLWSTLLLWTAASWVLTSVMGMLDALVIERAVFSGAPRGVPLPTFSVYLPNWILDLCIFAVTVNVLYTLRDRSRPIGVFAISASVGVASLLYVACLFCANLVSI